MPFTLSHAVAALPGIGRDGGGRGPLVPSALVAGTMAPDTVYFADSVAPGVMRLGEVTHSAVGVLTLDVVVAGLLVVCWLLVRGTLVALLPGGVQGRVGRLAGWGRWRGRAVLPLAGWFAVSAALGAMTHVVWDAFTHPGRWGVRAVPVLDHVVAGWPLYSFLQYGSSAVALLLLAGWLARALRTLPPVSPPAGLPPLSRRSRACVLALLTAGALLGAVHRCLRWQAVSEVPLTPLDLVPTALFGAGAGLALTLPVVAAAVALLSRRRRAAARTGAATDAGRGDPARPAAEPTVPRRDA